MRYIIETTKTDAGTRVLPIAEDVAQMFQAIIEDRNAPKVEKAIDGYSGFLFYDDNGNVAFPIFLLQFDKKQLCI